MSLQFPTSAPTEPEKRGFVAWTIPTAVSGRAEPARGYWGLWWGQQNGEVAQESLRKQESCWREVSMEGDGK